MALTACRECEAQVADSARTCPHCGIGRPDQEQAKRATVASWAGFVVLAVLGVLLFAFVLEVLGV